MNPLPKIKLQPSGLDKRMDLAGIVFLAVSWLITIYGLLNYPEIIPVHFNAAGVPDGYGSKFTLLLLPLIATVIWVGITLLSRSPHVLNYPVTITEENAEMMYRSATRLMRIIKNSVALLFLMILYATHRVVTGKATGIGKGFLFFALAMLLLPVFFYVISMVSAKKSRR